MKTWIAVRPLLALALVILASCGAPAERVQRPAEPPANAGPTNQTNAGTTNSSTTAYGGTGALTIGTAPGKAVAVSPGGCPAARGQYTAAMTGVITDAQGKAWTVPAAIQTGDTGTELFNDCTGSGRNADYAGQLKTVVIDPDGVEITAAIHADNYFELFVNGSFVCRDAVAFTPFNSTICRFKARYPITYALRAVDWEEHLGLGLEYDQYHVGDGGIAARFSDGTVTDASWVAQPFYVAPLDDPNCVQEQANGARDTSTCATEPNCVRSAPTSCQALHWAEPSDWAAPAFAASGWNAAHVYTSAEFGPKAAYTELASEFGSAQFIWSPNLKTDNLVLLRYTRSQ